MKRLLAALAALLCLAAPASADYTYRDANSVIQIFLAWVVSGKILPVSSAVDANGNSVYTAPGAPNTSNALTTQGADMRPTPATITIQDTGSSSASGQGGVSIVTGTPTVASYVAQAVNGLALARFQLSGTWTGTISFEQSIDGGTTWGMLSCHLNGAPVGVPNSIASATANGLFDCEAAGASNIRARATAAMTGTATVTMAVSNAAAVSKIINSIGVKDNVSGQQVTIKPGSTAPVAGDTPLVVGLHPSSLLPAFAANPTFIGNVSNASTGVSTTSTNIGTNGYLYGWNGSAWDRLLVDGGDNLKVLVNSALPVGANIVGKFGIDQTTPGTTNGIALVGVNGATALAGNGATGTGSLRVTIASDNSAIAGVGAAATGSAAPANAAYQGVNIGGNLTGLVGDACAVNAHSYTPINISTAANTKIVTGTSAKKTYLCHLFLFSAGTQNVGIVEGSGTNCATSPLGVIGGATAATGPNLTAQTGFVEGTGANAVAATTVNANDFCLITSAAVQLSGVAVTVQQ